MGLFTRKGPAPDSATGKPRPSVSSEAQAAQLRARARRRLAGAVALVLAAVIILPMVLDSEPTRVSDDIPIRVPDRNAPYQPNVSDPQQTPPAGDGGTAANQAGGQGAAGSDTPTQPPAVANSGTPAQPPASENGAASGAVPPAARPPETKPRTETARPESKPESKPEARAETKPEHKPAAKPADAKPRSDDGARALALLEGKTPPPAAPSRPAEAKGNFVLQIAAYTTQADAQARRDKLHAAGVTNAFVQEATISGKQQYRLRVGPFPSRDAAQAAQARLRTLGYDNGFIAAQ